MDPTEPSAEPPNSPAEAELIPLQPLKVDRRKFNLASTPRDAKGRVLPTKPQAETQDKASLGSDEQMMSEILRGLGGWKKACRMYAKSIRSPEVTANKRIDALSDFFKFLFREKSKVLSAEDMLQANDEELVKIMAKHTQKKA